MQAHSQPKLTLPAFVLTLVLTASATLPVLAAQPSDESQSHPPVTKSDVEIVEKARQILNSPSKWNRSDKRNCPNSETKFSLYCALEEATYEVTQDFAHRGAAMQEARFVIDNDLAPNNHYDHRLMDFNNDPHTTFADVLRFFDLLQGRVEGRLEQEEIARTTTSEPGAASQIGAVTQTDIDVIKKVQAILDSPAKWDKGSSQTCDTSAKTLGLYCAFEAASIAVTGRSDYAGPAIGETRVLISRTAPNAPHYNARLVDYNNDPTITFDDLQRLLKTAENNLEKRLSR